MSARPLVSPSAFLPSHAAPMPIRTTPTTTEAALGTVKTPEEPMPRTTKGSDDKIIGVIKTAHGWIRSAGIISKSGLSQACVFRRLTELVANGQLQVRGDKFSREWAMPGTPGATVAKAPATPPPTATPKPAKEKRAPKVRKTPRRAPPAPPATGETFAIDGHGTVTIALSDKGVSLTRSTTQRLVAFLEQTQLLWMDAAA